MKKECKTCGGEYPRDCSPCNKYSRYKPIVEKETTDKKDTCLYHSTACEKRMFGSDCTCGAESKDGETIKFRRIGGENIATIRCELLPVDVERIYQMFKTKAELSSVYSTQREYHRLAEEFKSLLDENNIIVS